MDFAAAISKLRALPSEQLLAQASRSVPPWLSLVLAVAVAWNVGGIVWLLVPEAPPGEVAPPPPPDPDAAGADVSAAGHDVQRIADAHLFGTFNPQQATAAQQEAAAAAALADADLPDTRLPLKLLGVLADGFGGGQAVIVNGRGAAAVYRVNDPIEGQNARVDAVFDTWVRLRIGGRAERLTLPDFDENATAPARRRTSAVRRTSTVNQNLVNELVATSGGSIRLSDIVRPQPVFANGELEGYRVYPGRNRQAFSRLGLRPGDLVTGVNGTTITDPKQGIEMFRQLEGSAPIAVTVERGGQVETVVLDTSALGLGSR